MCNSNRYKNQVFILLKKGPTAPFRILSKLFENYLNGNLTTLAFTNVFLISINISVPAFA